MNRINENLWPALVPPPDFADKAVERMLARDASAQLRRISSRRLAGLLLAAVFVTGAAFGISESAKKSCASAVELAMPLVNPINPPMQQRVPRIMAKRPSALDVSVAPRALGKAIQPAASALPMAEASALPSSTPRVPACQCQRGFSDMICDCY